MSNKPSIENIDQWLFEAMEGVLSDEQQVLLDQFLVENPAYLDEQLAWSEAKVDATPIEYPNISALIQKPVWQKPVFWISTAALILSAFYLANTFFNDSIALENVAKTNELKVKSLGAGALENKMEKTIATAKTVGSSEELASRSFSSNEKSTSTQPDLANASNTYDSREKRAIEKTTAYKSTGKTKSLQSQAAKRSADVQPIVADSKQSINENPARKISKVEENILPAIEPVIVSTPISEQFVSEKAPIVSQIENTLNSSSSSVLTMERNTDLSQEFYIGTLPFKVAQTISGTQKELKAFTSKPQQDRIQSNANNSFSSRFKSFMQKLERMTDNPVALYNSKDQYYHAPFMTTLDANFASAGDRMAPRLMASSRMQWLGEENQQLMNSLSFDTYVRSLRGGIGVQMNHSYYGNGEFNNGQIGLAYSPKIGISKNWVIEPAVRFKIGNKSLQRANLEHGQNVEVDRGNVRTFLVPEGQSTTNDLWYQDVGVGLLANSKWFFVGVQIDNLGKHYNNFYSLSTEGEINRASNFVTATIGTDYVSRNKNISISPYVLYQKTEKLSEIWGGTIFRYKKFTLGGAYSSLGDYAGSIGIKTKGFMLTYNADFTTSSLLGRQILSHQAILRILIKNGRDGQKMLKL